MKTALITGITGQDGSYLAELLIEKGYRVHGVIRRSSSFNTGRINHLYNNKEILNKKMFLHYGDLADSSNLNRLLEKTRPDEIYNLGAQSHVQVSFEVPEYTADIDGIGILRFLDSLKRLELKQNSIRLPQVSFTGKHRKSLKRKRLPFILDHPMQLQNCTLTGSSKTTEKHMDCLP